MATTQELMETVNLSSGADSRAQTDDADRQRRCPSAAYVNNLVACIFAGLMLGIRECMSIFLVDIHFYHNADEREMDNLKIALIFFRYAPVLVSTFIIAKYGNPTHMRFGYITVFIGLVTTIYATHIYTVCLTMGVFISAGFSMIQTSLYMAAVYLHSKHTMMALALIVIVPGYAGHHAYQAIYGPEITGTNVYTANWIYAMMVTCPLFILGYIFALRLSPGWAKNYLESEENLNEDLEENLCEADSTWEGTKIENLPTHYLSWIKRSPPNYLAPLRVSLLKNISYLLLLQMVFLSHFGLDDVPRALELTISEDARLDSDDYPKAKFIIFMVLAATFLSIAFGVVNEYYLRSNRLTTIVLQQTTSLLLIFTLVSGDELQKWSYVLMKIAKDLAILYTITSHIDLLGRKCFLCGYAHLIVAYGLATWPMALLRDYLLSSFGLAILVFVGILSNGVCTFVALLSYNRSKKKRKILGERSNPELTTLRDPQ